ncbi:MAG: capsid cement protein [Bacteroidota bacterium]
MQSIEILTLSILAASAIVQRRFVAPDGTQAGAAANTLGVASYDVATGDMAAVHVLGTTVVEAGGAVAAGAAIETDASGKAVTNAAGPVVGRALTAAAADGDLIEVLLIQN